MILMIKIMTLRPMMRIMNMIIDHDYYKHENYTMTLKIMIMLTYKYGI